MIVLKSQFLWEDHQKIDMRNATIGNGGKSNARLLGPIQILLELNVLGYFMNFEITSHFR